MTMLARLPPRVKPDNVCVRAGVLCSRLHSPQMPILLDFNWMHREILVSAGEASSDRYAALLVEELRRLWPDDTPVEALGDPQRRREPLLAAMHTLELSGDPWAAFVDRLLGLFGGLESTFSGGRVSDWPLGSPTIAVKSPIRKIAVWPSSWKCLSWVVMVA